MGLTYCYYGKLTLKKPGCEPYGIEVDDNTLFKDMHVMLKCDPNYSPPVAAPVIQCKPTPAGFAERLERLEALKRKGLVSESEYQQQRKLILNEL